MRYGDLLKEYVNKYKKHYILSSENLGPMYYVVNELDHKFIDVGIAEQSLIGIASGIALRGKIPVVHAMSSFLIMRAYEFIRTDIGVAELPVKLVGTSSGILSEWNGVTHQSIEDISLMMSIPQLNIFCPSDNQELLDGMKDILLDDKPWYIRYNDCNNKIQHQPFIVGKSEFFGKDYKNIIVTYGYMLSIVLKAKEYLKHKYGTEISVINLRTIRPLDESFISEVSNKCENLIIVEDHLIHGGVFTIISDFFLRNKKHFIPKMYSIGFNNYYIPGSVNDILNGTKLYVDILGERIQKLIDVD